MIRFNTKPVVGRGLCDTAWYCYMFFCCFPMAGGQVMSSIFFLRLNDVQISGWCSTRVHISDSCFHGVFSHDFLAYKALEPDPCTKTGEECVQSIAENHQLELLDFGWNSFDAECFAALGWGWHGWHGLRVVRDWPLPSAPFWRSHPWICCTLSNLDGFKCAAQTSLKW